MNSSVADDYLKQAKKATKKGFFTKPEWDIAGQYYSKAGTAYQALGKYEEAIVCFEESSNAFNKVSSFYFAAKALESAAQISEKKLNNVDYAIAKYQTASDLYMAIGNMPERSAELMEKAAKLSESIDVERAYQLYLNVISIYETENKNRFALQTFKNATSFLAEKKRYTEAIQLLHRLASLCSKINNHVEVGRCFLATIILLLAFGDEVEATKQFDVFAAEDPLFTRSDEYNASHQLLEAYKSYDQNLLNSAIKNRSLNDLHSSFRRVAYSLLVPGANSATSANPVSVTPGTTGPATAISGSPGGMDHHPDSSHATAHVPNLNIDNDDDLL